MSAKGAGLGGPKARLGIVSGARDSLELPAHIMRQVAAAVDFDRVSRAERWDLVRGLFAAMNAGPIGSGLAAPMTGVGLRVVVMAVNDKPLALINPTIVDCEGPKSEATEANLSLPGVRASVTRPEAVTVRWQSVNTGQERTATFEGWHARVLQHEIEILDGDLFVDRANGSADSSVRSNEERALAAVADWYGDPLPELPLIEHFGLALLPPSLHGLDTVLTRPASPVDDEGVHRDRLRALVTGMMILLYIQRGVGLAAPQIGLGLRITVIDSGEDRPLALINPTIVDCDEKVADAPEGCLSIPGWRGEVTRSLAVKVRADTVEGETVERDFSGYLARIVQHEIDHLDGVLFPSRMDPNAKLVVNDGELVAEDLTEKLRRFETQESRRGAERAKATKSPAKRRKKHRR